MPVAAIADRTSSARWPTRAWPFFTRGSRGFSRAGAQARASSARELYSASLTLSRRSRSRAFSRDCVPPKDDSLRLLTDHEAQRLR